MDFKKPLKIDFMTSKHGHRQISCMKPIELEATVEEIRKDAPKGALIVGQTKDGESVMVASSQQTKDALISILEERNQEFQKYMVMPPITAG